MAADAPGDRLGITQPPVHAIAVQRILERARADGPSTHAVAEDFLNRRWNDLMRWLAESVTPGRTAASRCTTALGIRDGQLSTVKFGLLSGRRDCARLRACRHRDRCRRRASAGAEYDRYLWLVEEMKSVGYDDELLPTVMASRCRTRSSRRSSRSPAMCWPTSASSTGAPVADVAELRGWAERFLALAQMSGTRQRGCKGFRSEGEAWIVTDTAAQFAPLLCGGLTTQQEHALLQVLDGPHFLGHPDLKFALIRPRRRRPKDFRPREYWRGPVWPVLNWLFSLGLRPAGLVERALLLRQEVCVRPPVETSPSTTNPSR